MWSKDFYQDTYENDILILIYFGLSIFYYAVSNKYDQDSSVIKSKRSICLQITIFVTKRYFYIYGLFWSYLTPGCVQITPGSYFSDNGYPEVDSCDQKVLF